MKVRVKVTNADGRMAERLLTEKDGDHSICHIICGLTRTLIDSGKEGDTMTAVITVDAARERPRQGGVAIAPKGDK